MGKIPQKKNIVVIGGGFAGVRAALDLDRRVSSQYRIILVDRNSYHAPYSMLYEAVSAYISGDHKADFAAVRAAIAVPFHLIIRNTNISFIKGTFEGIDFVDQRVKVDGFRIPYEYALLGLGSTTNYFSVTGLRDTSFPLKSLDDAQNLRNAIEELFARKNHDEQIHIVVGGAGFTGVEVASELPALLSNLSRKYKRARKTVTLTLVEAAGTILPGAKPGLLHVAEKRLTRLGVVLQCGSAVRSLEGGRLMLSSNVSIPADLVAWTAGISVPAVTEKIPDVPREKGYLVTDEFLRFSAHPEVYAIGDLVYCMDKRNQCSVAATAQRALAHGECAAENIYRTTQNLPLLEYEPRSPAFVVPLGGKYATADLWGFRLSGILPWILKLLIEYSYLLSILPVLDATKKWMYGVSVYIKND